MHLANVPDQIGNVPSRTATHDRIEVPLRRIGQGKPMKTNRLDGSFRRKHPQRA